jgi:hypothetical protein
MSIGKKLTVILLTMLLVFGTSGRAFAYESTQGSITLTLSAGDTVIIGGSLSLYRVGDLADPLTLNRNFRDAAQDNPLDLENADLAKDLAEYVQEKGLKGTVGQVSDQGTVTFSQLEKGVYLIKQETAFQNGSDIAPFLVAIPQQGTGRYNIDASPKVMVLNPEEPEPSEGPEVSPNVSPEVSPSASPEVSPSVSPEASPGMSPGPSSSPTVSPSPATSVSPSPSASPTGATLPKTGQLNWPIPLMALAGVVLLLVGWRLYVQGKREKHEK